VRRRCAGGAVYFQVAVMLVRWACAGECSVDVVSLHGFRILAVVMARYERAFDAALTCGRYSG